jgi:hypothetical protein
MPDQDQEQLQPPQRQSQPGIEEEMTPTPDATSEQHQGSGKLAGKVALISGGDSGIERAVAVLFAREGADVAIGHLAEEDRPGARRVARWSGSSTRYPAAASVSATRIQQAAVCGNPCSSTTGSPVGGPAPSMSNTSPRAWSRSRCISIAPLGMPGRVAALVTLKPVWCSHRQVDLFARPRGG